MKDEELIKLVDRKVAELGEHVEAVQILVSWNENGHSRSLYRGGGNWFARRGMATDFIEQDQSRTAGVELAKAFPESE